MARFTIRYTHSPRSTPHDDIRHGKRTIEALNELDARCALSRELFRKGRSLLFIKDFGGQNVR